MARSQLNSGTARPGDLPAALWAFFSRPLALWIPGALALLLALAGLWLPQMPGQLVHEPASAARWLAIATEAPLGDLWRTLGLYNVLAHPILYLALAAMIAVLAIRVAQHISALRTYYKWPEQAFSVPVTKPGAPVALDRGAPLHRLRKSAPYAPAIVDTLVGQVLQQAGVTDFKRKPVPYTDTATPPEIRYRWVYNQPYVLARLLRDGALLLAVTVAWINVVFGWHIATPILAPGESFQSTGRGIQIQYHINSPEPATGTQTNLGARTAATLYTSSGTQTLPSQNGRHLAGDLLTITHQAAPGLRLSMENGENAIRRLGQGQNVTTLGLVMAEPGDEETVLLPELAAGLRIVRRTGSQEMWLVEFYEAGDVQPRAQWEIEANATSTLVLPESQVRIRVEPAAGLQFEIYHMPGHRLIWLGIGLALLAAVALVRRPFFAMLQIGPWHDQSVVIIQTTDMNNGALRALRAQEQIWHASDISDPETVWEMRSRQETNA